MLTTAVQTAVHGRHMRVEGRGRLGAPGLAEMTLLRQVTQWPRVKGQPDHINIPTYATTKPIASASATADSHASTTANRHASTTADSHASTTADSHASTTDDTNALPPAGRRPWCQRNQ
eukprot:356534-Chlamydomonas_euryale.AAC.2